MKKGEIRKYKLLSLLFLLLSIIPDKIYLKFAYRVRMNKSLDIKNPKTLNEKIQWLKLYDREEIYRQMVDKYDVREYIAEKIGEQYLMPLAYEGFFENANDIPFDELPDRFVLKTTHDSGGIVICHSKDDFNRREAVGILNMHIKRDFSLKGREWPYHGIKPKIIVEKYMEDEHSRCAGLTDYKFYCFNGKAYWLYVSEGLYDHRTAKMNFFDMKFEKAPFWRQDYAQFDKMPEKPDNFEKMIEIAEKLAEGMIFIRVDLYEINGKIYFSELTFSPCSGYMPFEPEEWDEKLGEQLELPCL